MRIRTATWATLQAGGDQAALMHALYRDLMVALAGQAAQKLAGYPDGNFGSEGELGEGSANIDNAIDYALRLARIEARLPIELGPDEPLDFHPGDPLHTDGIAIVERAAAETVAMLEDNWLAVVRVAGALVNISSPKPSSDHVIAHGQRGRPR